MRLALALLVTCAVGCDRTSKEAPTPSPSFSATASSTAAPSVSPTPTPTPSVRPTAEDSAPRPCTVGAALVPWRYSPTATRLLDGRVLVAGGRQHDGGGYMREASLYDPSRDAFTPVARMAEGRAMHAAARVADGRVVVAGGMATGIELFDPKTLAWTRLGKTATAVAGLTVTALVGRAVVVGGDLMWKGAKSTEVYVVDPATKTVKPGAPLPESRSDHVAFALPDGRLRIVAGQGSFLAGDALAPTLTSDVAVEAWTVGPDDDETAAALRHASRPKGDFTLLRPVRAEANAIAITPKTVMAFVPGPGWTVVATFGRDRVAAAGVMLDDRKLLVVGGLEEAQAPIEICDLGARAAGGLASEVGPVVGLPGADVRSWNGIRDGAVALQNDGPTRVRLAVAQKDGAWRRVAAGSVTFAHEGCDAGEPADKRATLDLAPYRLDEATVAIGVRFTCARTYPAGEGSETWLHLFRIRGEAIEQVLATSVKASDHQRGPGEDVETTGTVHVEPRAGGFADLVVRRTTVVTPLSGAAGKKATRNASERFAWDGSVYRAQETKPK